MLINVKDSSAFLPKDKLPAGFRQMGRVTFGSRKSGLLLYQEESEDFYGMFGSGLERLDRPEVLTLLGLAYIKYDPREASAKGGRKNKGRVWPREHMKKMWDGARSARIRKLTSAN